MSSAVTDLPDGIGRDHVEPTTGWRRHASPVSLVVFGTVIALGLAGVLGHERTWRADDAAGTLVVHMPEVIRNGEFFEMRISVESVEPLGELVVGVDQSLWEDITVNTLIPAAAEESSADGEFRFTFGDLAAGVPFLLKVDAQVNPDIVGGNAGTVTVYDGDRPLSEVMIEMRVLP
jgi:hypothetical protein